MLIMLSIAAEFKGSPSGGRGLEAAMTVRMQLMGRSLKQEAVRCGLRRAWLAGCTLGGSGTYLSLANLPGS